MARNLYRFYLYAVSIALLIFATVATSLLLNTLLAFTPLRGSYDSVPDQASVIQSLVFAVVSWIIAGLLIGLHYWLIRRDLREDTTAGTSAIRSFFLNIPEAIAILLGVPIMGFLVIESFARYSGGSVVNATASALPALALAALLEWERRRIQVTTGAARAFQRLHYYGVQAVLLFFVTFAWLNIRPLVDAILFGGKEIADFCGGSACSPLNLFGFVITILWFVAFWVGYGLMIRGDESRHLRLILHGASFAYGVGYILSGIFYGIEALILPLFNVTISRNDVLGISAMYDFVTPLTLGILVVGVYHLWLNLAVKRGLMGKRAMLLTESAIIGVLSAITFWSGMGYALYNALKTLVPVPAAPDVHAWATVIALIIAGLGYIPLDFYLYRRHVTDQSSAVGPRRGFVLALLGGGILAFAVGGTTAFYAWATSLFGSPITNWQEVAQAGLSTFVVGVILVGIYLLAAMRERLFTGQAKRSVSVVTPAPTLEIAESEVVQPMRTVSIEDVLDELTSGKITRDEAAGRIRAMSPSKVSHRV